MCPAAVDFGLLPCQRSGFHKKIAEKTDASVQVADQ
jgi:hypothetical protein